MSLRAGIGAGTSSPVSQLKGHTMLVRELMKEAVWLQPDETLTAAARKLRKDNLGCLPVCDDGRILGMITDRDIAMRMISFSKCRPLKVSIFLSLSLTNKSKSA